MLNHIAVRNFQSLKQVDLDLGTFTVIVGPSSSGKSALMRAFRAVASNVRGGSVITRGQKQMAITYTTDRWTVTLERTEKSGMYRLADAQDLSELAFTKLNGEVPPHVTNALLLEPVPVNGTSVNFASQFDKPYLLDESGAVVARVLGELTNVNTIFEAVRQANKIRLAASSTLKTRRADLEGLKLRIGQFEGLSQRLQLLAEAEKDQEQLDAVGSRITRLETALRTLRVAQHAIDKVSVPVVPSPDGLNQALNSYLDLDGKLRGLKAKTDRAEREKWEFMAFDNDLAHLEETLVEKLREARVCPTCGQSTV